MTTRHASRIRIAVAVGVAGLVLAFLVGPALDAWLWMVIGFVYFLGLAMGMLAWSAAFRVAQARWTRTIGRLGHSAIGFLPFAYVILIILLLGARGYMPWIAEPVPAKQAWLNAPFMVVRQLIGLGVLFFLSFLMVKWSLLADEKASRGEAITPEGHHRLNAISVAVVITYVVVFTIVAYDFIMSLSPGWVSTMFGPYYWITSLYTGLAALILMAAFLRGPLDAEEHLEAQHFQDLGNLMLGFGLFSMGLFFAQYLTIWYGNLPWETDFLIVRYLRGGWPMLGWVAFALGYGLPFLLLQSRTLKRNPRWLAPVAMLALVGVALERYVLVVPSWRPEQLLLFPLGVLGLLAFKGVLVLAVLWFFSKYSPVSAADEALPEKEILEELL